MHPVIGFTALLCIAVGAGAAGALNMWYDADIDAVMTRTARRPIPAGRIAPGEALAFGSTLAGFSVVTLGLLVNWLAAALLAFTIFFYVVVYTMWLKRSTPQNIVIGGAAGAFPPMIGWAAATGGIGARAVVLCSSSSSSGRRRISGRCRAVRTEDYARAGVPMLPVVAGDGETRGRSCSIARARAGRDRAVAARLCRRALWVAAVAVAPAHGRAGLAGALASDDVQAAGARRAAVRLLDPLSVRAVRALLVERDAGRARAAIGGVADGIA